MRSRLTGRDRLLLLATLPLFVAVFAAHVHESARTGLAQLPLLAEWQPGDYPQMAGQPVETDSSGSGLELGDRLIRIGDRDLTGEGFIGVQAIALSLTTPGHPVPLLFERAGRRHTVPLEARPHPHPFSRVPMLLLIPAVCVLLLLRAPGQPDVQRFYLCFMTYAIGQAQFYGGPEWQTWLAQLVWFPASVLMLFFMLRWVRLFPSEMSDVQRVPAWLPWLAAALYAVVVRLSYLTGWPVPVVWVPRVSFAMHAFMTLVGIGVLAWNYLHARPAGRRRLRWILLGLALGSVPVALGNFAPLVVPEWHGFRELFALGFLSSAIWMMGAVLGTVRDNAFDVDRLIGATAAGALAAAGVVAGLAIAAPALSSGVSDALGIEPTLSRVALAALLGALAIPLAVRLRPQVDRLLFPGRVALQEGASRLADELAHCETPAVLLERAAERSAALFDAGGFAFYVREGERFARRGGRDLGPELLPAGFQTPSVLSARKAPAAMATGAAIVLPVCPGDDVAALVCLGPKRSGDIYTTSDEGVLAAIGARVEREWLRFQKLAADRESREKTNLLAAASHDLRQPLHAVSLLTEALRSKLADPETRALVERIGDSTHELDEMLSGLLERARLDAGGVQPHVRALALADVFAQLERDFAPQAEAAGVRLRIAPTQLAVRSDRLLLSRILSNLVSNALRHAVGAPVLVCARARGERVVIEVRDAGPGIPLENQTEIFDAFRQLSRSRSGGWALGSRSSTGSRASSATSFGCAHSRAAGRRSRWRSNARKRPRRAPSRR